MRIRKTLVAAVFAMLVLPALAAAETWKNVPLIDHDCLNKVKADPDKHPTSCLIMCSDSGYGVLTSDGSWLKFDKSGNEKALKALHETKKTAGIRVTVNGERQGDEIKVATITID
jgi:hypothetical protein